LLLLKKRLIFLSLSIGLTLLVVSFAGDSTHRHALNETISGLVAGNGTGIASELHGASVSGGGLVDVDLREVGKLERPIRKGILS